MQSTYAVFYILGLPLIIICAWFSTGHLYPDEHFQILEFCNYKMGKSPADELPWEFQDRMRSGILPGFAYMLGTLMEWYHIYNPFILNFFLRLIMGLLSWVIICRNCLVLQLNFDTDRGKKLFLLLSMFLWFVPILCVHFTSEQMSGSIFLLGFYLILRPNKAHPNLPFFVAGFLFGLSFIVRIQMAVAIGGFFAYLLCIKKLRWSHFALMVFALLISIGLGAVIDYWFYGEWLFPPFNNFYENIIKHKAEQYGISPWWNYFVEFLTLNSEPPLIGLILPFNLILLMMFITGVVKNLKDPAVWIIIPFILVHCSIHHKEIRFLYPMVFLFIYLVAKGFDYIFINVKQYQPVHLMLLFLFVINILFLTKIIMPANFFEVFYQKIDELNTTPNNNFIYLAKRDFFEDYYLKVNFFKTKPIKAIVVKNNKELVRYLHTSQLRSAYLISNQPTNIDVQKEGYQIIKVYPSSFSHTFSSFDKAFGQRTIEYIYRIS
jgi:phosphatidylinositol glycan class B